MKRLDLNQIRKEYLDFFESKDHIRLKSYSLIPEGDDSLLLINAGMAPLKPYFLGEKKMAKNRATSSQRCVRTMDIDRVGKTHRHGTFFEMLGNFSFGDYFKREAIHWAYEFLTERLELEKDKLWISVYLDDDEAYDIWTKEIGIPAERMLRLGKEDNFWELEQGPCGPCSEIHYDRGPAYGGGTNPTENSDRFMEVWNLVFTQFNRGADGSYTPLANPNIDTGMGLERISLVCEDAANIFDLSAFRGIRNRIEELCGKKYGSDSKTDESIRVIMDHSKALTFLVYDGVVPSNEGRGYVLRRLLRRAARHGKLLGIKDAFLNEIVDAVAEAYRSEYPELLESKDRIHRIVAREEESFRQTIEQGLSLLSGILEDLKAEGKTELSGKDAFKLYDTYGFPLDLTKEILEEENFTVDESSFDEHMQKQRTQSRERRQMGGGWSDAGELDTEGVEPTQFLGYEKAESLARVTALYRGEERVERLEAGEEGTAVLDRTSFYAESGGQVGDTGVFRSDDVKADVLNVTKNADSVFFHTVKVLDGALSVGSEVSAHIDEDRRNDIRRNHSATHLLHRALRDVLGDHVHQAGSLVDDQRLRFDFTHFEAMTDKERAQVEDIVNRAIFDSYPVTVEEMDLSAATEKGAIGLFEDKYKDRVRVVSMGDFSMELCGGTHVDNTSQVQMLRILSEQGISSGVRRIEATTGRGCYRQILAYDEKLSSIADKLKTDRSKIEDRIEQLKEENKELGKKLESFAAKEADSIADKLASKAEDVDGVKLIAARVDGRDMNQLKELVDHLKAGFENYCIVLASECDGKVYFASCVDKASTKRGLHAGNTVREAAKMTGGNGGGRPEFATAGGKDASKIDEALKAVGEAVRANLK